jgi:hypothetical protein
MLLLFRQHLLAPIAIPPHVIIIITMQTLIRFHLRLRTDESSATKETFCDRIIAIAADTRRVQTWLSYSSECCWSLHKLYLHTDNDKGKDFSHYVTLRAPMLNHLTVEVSGTRYTTSSRVNAESRTAQNNTQRYANATTCDATTTHASVKFVNTSVCRLQEFYKTREVDLPQLTREKTAMYAKWAVARCRYQTISTSALAVKMKFQEQMSP